MVPMVTSRRPPSRFRLKAVPWRLKYRTATKPTAACNSGSLKCMLVLVFVLPIFRLQTPRIARCERIAHIIDLFDPD